MYKLETMSTIELKDFIHRQIDGLKDEKFLQAVYSMIHSYIEDGDEVVGYNSKGEPLTKENLRASVSEAEKRIDAGQFTTQEELKKESENW